MGADANTQGSFLSNLGTGLGSAAATLTAAYGDKISGKYQQPQIVQAAPQFSPPIFALPATTNTTSPAPAYGPTISPQMLMLLAGAAILIVAMKN
jgi:hypothetical protein